MTIENWSAESAQRFVKVYYQENDKHLSTVIIFQLKRGTPVHKVNPASPS